MTVRRSLTLRVQERPEPAKGPSMPSPPPVQLAFSTVAVPEWTLEEVAGHARAWGYAGVELRTFSRAPDQFACEPMLTDPEKARGLFAARGIAIAGLATSCRFDEPVRPPVIGHVLADTEASVREARRAVDLGVALECPLVRVFAFEARGGERRASVARRVTERLRMVMDHAHNTGVRVVLENGGTFPDAPDVAAIIDDVGSSLLGACYAPHAAVQETVGEGVNVLGRRLWMVRVKDVRADGRPCQLGEGRIDLEGLGRALTARAFRGWIVYEWDRAWIKDLADADQVLPRAAGLLTRWIGAPGPAEPVRP